MATGTSGTERTIGQLVADATHDLEGIVRGEIALAKAEVTDGAKVLGKGAGLLAGAAFLAVIGFVFLLHSAAWGISTWLPVLRGYLIVAVVVLIVGAILGLMGKKALDQAKPAPERAIDQAQQTITADIKNPKGEPDAVAAAAGAVTAGATTAGQAATGATASGSTGGTPGAPGRRPRQPERHRPVDTGCEPSTPRRRTGAISSRVSA